MSSPVPTQTVAPAGGDDIRGIKGPIKIPNPWLPFFWVTGIAIALLIGWRLWRRKQKAMATPALVPGDSPQQRARTALNGSLKSLGDPPVFCTRISDALRVFLEEQFGLQAPDRTTEEFLQHLEPASPLSTDQQQSIATFLARCDLVKFARHHPPGIRTAHPVPHRSRPDRPNTKGSATIERHRHPPVSKQTDLTSE